MFVVFLQNMGWATFWAIFSQTHLVTPMVELSVFNIIYLFDDDMISRYLTACDTEVVPILNCIKFDIRFY
jgi:hypothetical protein